MKSNTNPIIREIQKNMNLTAQMVTLGSESFLNEPIAPNQGALVIKLA